MNTVDFIAAQRIEHGISVAVSCRVLGVSTSWYYKWRGRPKSARQDRRDRLDAEIKQFFKASGKAYGSPRIWVDLVEDGWKVSVNTVAARMAALGLYARKKKRFKNTTIPDTRQPPAPDLVGRDFNADEPDQKWCGDITEIACTDGKLYLATVEDLFSRRMLGWSIAEHMRAELVRDAVNVAVAVRGGNVDGVIFHSDRGSQYGSGLFKRCCKRLGIRRSHGRVGSCFDNSPSESFFSTLKTELEERLEGTTKAQARRIIAAWVDQTYNRTRRHSTSDMKSPIDYELDHQAAA